MSATGQDCGIDQVGSPAVLVATFAMPTASRYTRHTHDTHQLAWAARGVLIVATDAGTWVLPPARALWIPAGVEHETIASATTTMRSLYFSRHMCPITWSQPQPVAANPLFAELIGYLARSDLGDERRERAEAVLLDLLEPVAVATVHAPVPDDDCAAQVARSLLDNPADQRSLEEWGRQVCVSARTLARAFHRDTGLGFDRWRTLARIQAALPELAAGEPVSHVARHVGYQTTSAFVAAFRRETDTTPGAYFQAKPA
ncbi:MAG TPA: helix-turn-helix transcriptional regulator [Jatrophihabitantaceae bacterium]|nr:helix-turn-helix transcriptional regulator [Jatrophihabitantaceae bacterium]